MSHRNRTAVDVDLAMIEPQRLHIAQHHTRERLVQLVQVDIGNRHSGPLQNLARHELRPGQHDRRFRPDRGHRPDAGARLKAIFLAHLAVADQHRRGAVDDAAGIAGMVDMVDLLDLRIALQSNRIKARHLLPHRLKGGRQACHRLHVGARPHMFVMREHNLTNHVAHADHRILEPALAPSLSSPLLALHRIGIDIITAEAIFGGNQVGPNALRHEIGLVGHRRVHRPGTAVGPHRHPRHALDAAADCEHRLTGHHLGRCHIAGFKP